MLPSYAVLLANRGIRRQWAVRADPAFLHQHRPKSAAWLTHADMQGPATPTLAQHHPP